MYNKLFCKILDSSIWLEDASTRLVWLTMIAVMDEEGFVQMASIANLAHRARVTHEEATEAVGILEGNDPNSSDPEHEGKRIEKVPGGWMVLNAPKYRDIVTREESKRKNRERVQRHRAKKKQEKEGSVCNENVTERNEGVMNSNESVMQSDTDTETDTNSNTTIDVEDKDNSKDINILGRELLSENNSDDSKKTEKVPFDTFWNLYDKKRGKPKSLRKWNKLPLKDQHAILEYIPKYKESQPDKKYRKDPMTFLNNRSWEDEIISDGESQEPETVDLNEIQPTYEQHMKENQPIYGWDWDADFAHEQKWEAIAHKYGITILEYGAWRKRYSEENGPYTEEIPEPQCEYPALTPQPLPDWDV